MLSIPLAFAAMLSDSHLHLAHNWFLCATVVLASCLVRCCYKRLIDKRQGTSNKRTQSPRSPSQTIIPPQNTTLGNMFASLLRRPRHEVPEATPPPSPRAMRYTRRARNTKKVQPIPPSISPPSSLHIKQPYEAFLVLDVEATCHMGTDFNFPNEIIEFPVCLMRWKDRTEDNRASQLEVVDEFRSFVRPTWRPTLSQFCTDLTGITQAQVDSAPFFPEVLEQFYKFLIKHNLVDEETGERSARFCWCSDGPFDVRDFVVKQCFISRIAMPEWIKGDVLDVRMSVMQWLSLQPPAPIKPGPPTRTWDGPKRRSLNIPSQLKALGLPTFEGRQHSGIDDTRNIAKIVAELARKGISLQPNTAIYPDRRWLWMGKHGQVLEDYCVSY